MANVQAEKKKCKPLLKSHSCVEFLQDFSFAQITEHIRITRITHALMYTCLQFTQTRLP